MILEVPVETPSLTNQRGHWGKKAGVAKKHRDAVYWVWRSQPDADRQALKTLIRAGGRVRVHLVRCSPRALDDDNLQAALKSVRDGIAARLGVDDRDQRVAWSYGQRSVRVHYVEVTVEPLS